MESSTTTGVADTNALAAPILVQPAASACLTLRHSSPSQVEPSPPPIQTPLFRPARWSLPVPRSCPVRAPSLCVLPPVPPSISPSRGPTRGVKSDAAELPCADHPPAENWVMVPDAASDASLDSVQKAGVIAMPLAFTESA